MLRPTFLSFETTKRALQVSQMGLDTVGHNISNAQTPGYTRQRVDQVSISSGGYGSKYQIRGGASQFSGQGSIATGVSQVRDPFLDTRYRNEASNYGQHAMTVNGLTDLENVLDEISTNGLSAQMGDFISELTKYMNDASSPEFATVVRNSASKLVQMMNKTASELKEVLNQQKGDLQTAIATDVNVVLEQIASLNKAIREDAMYGNPSNELNDARNFLIDQLSEFLPIKVVHTPEKISDDLTISKVSIVLMSTTDPSREIKLVDGEDFNSLIYTDNSKGNPPSDTVSISVKSYPQNIDITSTLSGGAIRGYLDIVNGQGDYAGPEDNGFRGVPYYQKQIDTFARTFAETMNRLNSIHPSDIPAGSTTVKPHLDKNLFTDSSGVGTANITAANIQISSSWMSEVNYLTTSKQDPAKPEPVLDEHGNPKLDAEGNIIYKTTANTDNLARILEALKGNNNFSGTTNNGGHVPLFSGSFQEFLGSVQSDLSLDKQLSETLLNSSSTVISGFADQRDAVSAVSIDEEAMNMMVYQNFYNAAARYMTTIDEALGTIIQGMGVVGR